MVTTLDPEAYEKSFQDLQHEYHRDERRIAVARAEGTEFNSIPAASFTEKKLTWSRVGDDGKLLAGGLVRAHFRQIAGTATSFDVHVRNKANGSGLDLIFSTTGIISRQDFVFPIPVPFVSEETGADKGAIWVAIRPIGNPGSYTVRLYAFPMR